MPRWIVGLVIGVLALFVANWAIGQAPDVVSQIVADMDLAAQVIGFIGVSIGLGSLSFSAVTKGINALGTEDVAGPGVFAIAGAILLAAA